MDHYFSDMVIVGTPDDDSVQVTENLATAIERSKAALNEDPRYQAEIDRVTTHDPHRIYAVRLSHGGRPHYLVAWDRYKRAYRAWRKKQAHPIHVLCQRHVAKMPSLEPIESGSEGDTAFALALAYGWIAKRGAYYYFNLACASGVESARSERNKLAEKLTRAQIASSQSKASRWHDRRRKADREVLKRLRRVIDGRETDKGFGACQLDLWSDRGWLVDLP